MKDPDPRVSGAGLSQLKAAGIELITGVLDEEAACQNKAFTFRIQTGRPMGILKWAMSLDGRTALPNGHSKWISGHKAREWVHRLRAKCDAVIVGGGTLRSDDPLLTSRGISNPEPLRVVLTKNLQLPLEAKLWDTSIAKTLIAYGPEAPIGSIENLPKGPEQIAMSSCEPIELLQALAKKGFNRVLWECGPSLATKAIEQGCVQELAVVIAPKLLGGKPSRTPLADFGFTAMDQVLAVKDSYIEPLGEDLLLKIDFSKDSA